MLSEYLTFIYWFAQVSVLWHIIAIVGFVHLNGCCSFSGFCIMCTYQFDITLCVFIVCF